MRISKKHKIWLHIVYALIIGVSASCYNDADTPMPFGSYENESDGITHELRASSAQGGAVARSFSGYYYIQAVHSGKVISIEGPSHNDGAKIHQWDNIGWDNQMWRIEDRGGGYYQIISKYSNKALDVAYQSTADGGRIQQWSCSNGANQRWRIELLSNGCYRIVSQHSGKVLDVEGFRTDNGAQIQQWSWGGGTNQQWRLISAEGPQPGKYYRISALHSNKAISIAGPSPDDGANIHQWDYIQWNNQMWRLDDVGGGCYRIASKYSGKVLDVAAFSTQNGGNIQQWSWSGAANQKWRLEPLGGGFYRIVSQHSGKVLDVQGSLTENGRNIQQYTWNGGNNQKWYLECVGTGLPAVEAEANRYHLTQYYDVTYNSDGPWGSWNCGPTSLAMNVDALGKMPSGLTQNQRIRYMRSLVSNHVSNYIYINGQSIPQSTMGENGWNVGSDIWQIEDAVAELGGTTGDIWNRSDLDTALAAGRGAILVGYIDGEWRAQFPTTGRYGSGSIGHFLAVLGRTADGRYLVDDPMFTGGSVAMTYEQLSVFADGFYGVNGIWVGF